MIHTWEDTIQTYWETGVLLDGDSEVTRDLNQSILEEPGRVLPRPLWLQSREMPVAERR